MENRCPRSQTMSRLCVSPLGNVQDGESDKIGISKTREESYRGRSFNKEAMGARFDFKPNVEAFKPP